MQSRSNARTRVMMKYLSSRSCPKCRSSVIVMLLRFSSQISTINGICGHCDYSMKWLIIRSKADTAKATNLGNQIIAPPNVELEKKQTRGA